MRLLASETPGVRILGYVPDEELVWLYSNATAFVLMSQLEGFGMPVAEAATLGLPCLVTRGGVLEEVGGPFTRSADADDYQSIAQEMRGLAQLSMLERQAIARKTLEYIQKNFNRTEMLQRWRAFIENKINSPCS